VLNAEDWQAPFGPPVLQAASEHHGALARAAAEGREARLVAHMTREATHAYNVSVPVPGRDPALAPVIVMTPRSGWWTCTSERGGGLAVWFELLHLLAEHPPQRPVLFTANTGHELGHVGMRRFMEAHRQLVAGARAWLHLGANFAASLYPQVRLQCSDDALAQLAGDALARHDAAPDAETPVGERPFGEARDVHAGGGRYVSLVGRNGAFHHPDDRWPDMVDLGRTVRIVRAFREILIELARA